MPGFTTQMGLGCSKIQDGSPQPFRLMALPMTKFSAHGLGGNRVPGSIVPLPLLVQLNAALICKPSLGSNHSLTTDSPFLPPATHTPTRLCASVHISHVNAKQCFKNLLDTSHRETPKAR